jgi:hypothetical protein
VESTRQLVWEHFLFTQLVLGGIPDPIKRMTYFYYPPLLPVSTVGIWSLFTLVYFVSYCSREKSLFLCIATPRTEQRDPLSSFKGP